MGDRISSFHFLVLLGITVIASARNTISDRNFCGFQHSDDYDRPSSDISIDEFPWMVQLLYDNQTNAKCSGSLINERYVLSAAHCFKGRHSKLTAVRLGDHNVKTTQDCVQNKQKELECNDLVKDIEIEEINSHALYTPFSQHDISLIRLAHPVTYTDYIRPICLPERDLLESNNIHNLTSSGWGKLGKNLKQTEIKKRVPIKLVSHEECKTEYSKHSVNITENQICGRQHNSTTCVGDNGGPLMHPVKNQWEQVGIISLSSGCGKEHIVVYVKVFNYLEWIMSIIRP